MNDERLGAAADRLGDDEIAELIRSSGPRAPLPEIELAAIRAKTCAAWENEVGASKRQARRAWTQRLAIAAAAAGALLLVWLLRDRAVPMPPTEVATVAHVVGSLSVEPRGAGAELVSAGASLPAGATLMTRERGSRGAIHLTGGIAIRLDEATRVTLVSASEIHLAEGAVYVDTGSTRGVGKREAIEVRTAAGVARDVGTRFEVRVLSGVRAMVVRVREGVVIVQRDGAREEVPAGFEGTVGEAGEITTRPASAWGSGWEWIFGAGPPYEIEGRTLAEFLDWVEAETGWIVRYATPSIESRAREIVLHGSIERMRPDEAPFAILAGSGLEGTLADGVLTVKETK